MNTVAERLGNIAKQGVILALEVLAIGTETGKQLAIAADGFLDGLKDELKQ